MTNTQNMQLQSIIEPSAISAKSIWAGRVLSGLVVAFLLFDGILKIIPAQVVLDTIKQLGWSSDIDTARLLGLLTIVSTLLYAIPRTSVLGAILLTGYLGEPLPRMCELEAHYSPTFCLAFISASCCGVAYGCVIPVYGRCFLFTRSE